MGASGAEKLGCQAGPGSTASRGVHGTTRVGLGEDRAVDGSQRSGGGLFADIIRQSVWHQRDCPDCQNCLLSLTALRPTPTKTHRSIVAERLAYLGGRMPKE